MHVHVTQATAFCAVLLQSESRPSLHRKPGVGSAPQINGLGVLVQAAVCTSPPGLCTLLCTSVSSFVRSGCFSLLVQYTMHACVRASSCTLHVQSAMHAHRPLHACMLVQAAVLVHHRVHQADALRQVAAHRAWASGTAWESLHQHAFNFTRTASSTLHTNNRVQTHACAISPACADCMQAHAACTNPACMDTIMHPCCVH